METLLGARREAHTPMVPVNDQKEHPRDPGSISKSRYGGLRGRIQEGTLTGSVVFVVGFVVCWIRIAPWKFYARNYVCPVCRDSFGGGKEGSISESSHLKETHPGFYGWSHTWTVLQRF